jgi:hypothetical protein
MTLDSTKAACRAGALALLVVFWFDGGLFKLATASVFWILLELGAEAQKQKAESGNAEIDLSHIASTLRSAATEDGVAATKTKI